jgi:NAD(P)-dependent dehydrogenase (short-subunit alcohol dehydrogenase family)
MMVAMNGRTVLVTGATGGIGFETARALARRGAHLVMGARDASRGQAAVDRIRAAGGGAELLVLDLASFASVRDAARRLAAERSSLDVLVNNAGCVLRERRVTVDGHEVTWQTNFLGGFLLTRLLLPLLKNAAAPRVVNVSSEAHRTGRIEFTNLELERGYGAFRAYANSKLAQIHFTRELARREPGVAVNAVHPGTISTGIWRPAPAWFRFLVKLLLARAEKGARPVVRLAADAELDGVTGRYFDRFRETTPSAAARNDGNAKQLWEVAERATETPLSPQVGGRG